MVFNKDCCISGCKKKASKTKIIFGIYYNFCSDHGVIDLKTIDGVD